MQDLKHAFRVFMKSPGFAATVIITLALGISATTGVFSIIQGALLRPLPYSGPDRLIDILDSSKHEKELAKVFASYSDFEEFSRHAKALESIAALTWAGRPTAVLSGRGPTKAYLTIPVTAGIFKTLGVNAQLGRTFSGDDLRGGCAVVLSNKFWRTHLNADPHIVGEALTLDGQSCTVVGVMPSRFALYPPETQIWTLLLPNDPRLRNYAGVFMIARLRRGVSVAQARAELTALHSAMHAKDTSGERNFNPLVSGLQDQFTWLASRTLNSTLFLLFAAVVLVLSIACLNVASLLVGHALARGREFATRAALGIGRARLIRQLLIESAVLAFPGTALGVFLAYAGTRYFVSVAPVELPVGSNISIDGITLTFAVALGIASAVVFAVVPAWAMSRGDLYSGLRVTTGNVLPNRQRLSRALVIAQMALSVVLLVVAGVLLQSVLRFESAPLGFTRENVLASNGSLPVGYEQNVPRRIAFYDRLEQKLAAIPGISAAAVASTLPPYGLGLGAVEVEGKPVPQGEEVHDVGQAAVSKDYFSLFEIPLRRGRVFTANDGAQADHVAVVNEAFAREYFSGRNPIGEKIRLEDEHEWNTVVGVVEDEKRPTVYEEMKWISQPAVYRPMAQQHPMYFSIAVRSAMHQAGMARQIEWAVETVDKEVALGDIDSMQTRLAPYLKYPRFRAILLTAFSLIALTIAAIGLYGLLAQFVSQRTVEVGVRKAVGAREIDIVRLIAQKGGAPAVLGLAIGFCLSFGLTKFLRGLVYGITPMDPGTLVAVAIVMVIATALAIVAPVRRAMRLDPVRALRSE